MTLFQIFRQQRWLWVTSTLGSACAVASWDDLKSTSPVVAFIAPDNYPVQSFGAVLASYSGETNGVRITRIAASAGAHSPVTVSSVSTGDSLTDFGVMFDLCEDVATAGTSCEPGIGAAVVGLPIWRSRRDCILASAIRVPGDGGGAGEGSLRVQCEGTAANVERFSAPQQMDAGRSLAALPFGSQLGVALIGAPGAGNGGGLLLLRDGDDVPTALPFPSPEVAPDASEFGRALAVRESSPIAGLTSTVNVLVAETVAERVVVMTMGLKDGALEAVVHACIDGARVRSPSDSLVDGQGFALADFDGDDTLEAWVGRDDAVEFYEVNFTHRAVGCASRDTADDPTMTRVVCTPSDGVTCSRFGASIAGGDVNRDGLDEIVVGAPGATTPNGATGAAYFFEGSTSGVGAGIPFYASTLDDADSFGEEIVMATAGTAEQPRLEPVVSAPGRGAFYAFFCTATPGDASNGIRCQE